MKIEKDDITAEAYQAIAEMVIDHLRPLLSGNCKHDNEDIIFDKKDLTTYIHVSESTRKMRLQQ